MAHLPSVGRGWAIVRWLNSLLDWLRGALRRPAAVAPPAGRPEPAVDRGAGADGRPRAVRRGAWQPPPAVSPRYAREEVGGAVRWSGGEGNTGERAGGGKRPHGAAAAWSPAQPTSAPRAGAGARERAAFADDPPVVSPSDPRRAAAGPGDRGHGHAARSRRRSRPEGELAVWQAFVEAVDPYDLERIVLVAYERQGFHVRATPGSGDDGLDGVLFRDSTAIGIQVKRYRQPVGGPQMRDFVGTLSLHDLKHGIFLTTGRVGPKARRFAAKARIAIVEGEDMRALLMTHARTDVERVLAATEPL